eukprot:5681551-Pleurochrysis_carterae.AAC.1
MPGESEVQRRAQRQNCAFRLRCMLHVEGKCFYDKFIVPRLSEVWNLVHKVNPSAAREQLRQVPASLRLAGTVVCAFDVSRDTSLKYGSHVVFDAGQKFAIILKDHPGGAVAMGSYCRILHANLASLSGERLMMAAYASEDVLGKE